MFAETRDAPANARPFLERALAARRRCTPREQRFIEAVAAWVDGRRPRAPSRCTRSRRASIRATWPRSSSATTTCSTRATRPACCAWRWPRCRPPATCPTCTACWPSPGSSATACEQAEAAARQAIAMCRKEPWAHHALAHVMLTAGPHRRRACVPAGRERHLDRPELLHGHAQLVAPGPVRAGAGPARRSAGPVRPAGVGRGQGLLAGPDQRGVAAGAAGTCRRGRGQPLAGPGQLPGRAAARPGAAVPGHAVSLRPGARRAAGGRHA